MTLSVVGGLVGASLYLILLRSESQPMRIIVTVGAVVAVLSLLVGIVGMVLYYRTLTP